MNFQILVRKKIERGRIQYFWGDRAIAEIHRSQVNPTWHIANSDRWDCWASSLRKCEEKLLNLLASKKDG